MIGCRKTKHRQRGAVLAETAVVLPFLLFLILLTAEITNAFVDHNTLTKAVRGSARYVASRAILGTTGVVTITAQLVNEAQNLVVYGNVAGNGGPILPGLTVGDVQVLDVGGNNIQVVASHDYSGILGVTLPSFGYGANPSLTHTLRATVTMRAL
jgi:Flp pilus assembly protein TadG